MEHCFLVLGFSVLYEVNLPVTFRKLLWVPSSLVMNKNENNQRSGLLSYVGVEWAMGRAYDVQWQLTVSAGEVYV
jgi:hypothetical protein